MKKKIIIPLVTFTLSALLLIGSVNLFNLKTREGNKIESNNEIKETIVEPEKAVEEDNNNYFEKEVDDNSTINEEKTSKSETVKKEDNTKNNVVKNETVKENITTNKEEVTSQDSSSKQEENNSIEQKKEEKSNQNNSTPTSTNQNSTIYEIPDEDSKDKNNGSQDPEYLKIKDSCEFFTRAECQAALDDIMDKYITDEHPMVRSSCKSFAYNGEVVGYRVLLTYGDGIYFYNN